MLFWHSWQVEHQNTQSWALIFFFFVEFLNETIRFILFTTMQLNNLFVCVIVKLDDISQQIYGSSGLHRLQVSPRGGASSV